MLLTVVIPLHWKNIAVKVFMDDKLGVSVTPDRFRLLHPQNTPLEFPNITSPKEVILKSLSISPPPPNWKFSQVPLIVIV